MSLMPAVSSGVLNLALYMTGNGVVSEVRRVLSAIARTVEVRYGQPQLPASAIAHRRSILEVFMHGQRWPAKKEMEALATFFKGDWRSRTVVHHCSNTCCYSIADARAKAELAFKRLLKLAKPRMATRGNWTHALAAIIYLPRHLHWHPWLALPSCAEGYRDVVQAAWPA